MRLEITIPDSTRPAIKKRLSSLLNQLSAHPELVEEIHLNGADEDAPVSLTPGQIAKVRAAQEDIKAGRVLTLEQLDARLAANREAWRASNPS